MDSGPVIESIIVNWQGIFLSGLRKEISRYMIHLKMKKKDPPNTKVICPRCSHLVDYSQTRICPNCGVSLAFAAALAAQALQSSVQITVDTPIAPEILVPRIGDYLMEKGVLTEADLKRALDHSRELSSGGKPRLLGQVLLDLGLVNREVLDEVVTEQILSLQSALQKTNEQLEQRVRERTSELQNALNKLAELNQLKTNFISNVSHELRTPLTHLKGYLDLMATGGLGEVNEDQSYALDVMLRSETRLEELIEELLQFSLASSDQMAMRKESVDMAEMVRTAVEKAESKAVRRAVTVTMNLADDLPSISVDRERLQWAITELADNAIKFTPDGGEVFIWLAREDQRVRFTIRDTGIGISKEQLNAIFEPFHQLDGSITRRYGGVGLGLSLVFRIVEAHDAKITVESEQGQGTCFEFSLPI